MSFLDSISKMLEGLGEGLSKGLPLSQVRDISIQINSKNDNRKIEVKDNKAIVCIPKEDPDGIVNFFVDKFKKEAPVNSRIVDAETNQLIEWSEESICSEDEDLQYFRKLLRKDDIAILKASIVIKKAYEYGNSVQLLKQQLCERYGNRAGIIANLYSAGYFGSVIKPLNEELQKGGNYTIDIFRDRFDSLIEDFPMAIFVSYSMGPTKLANEIIKKAKHTKRYGIFSFNIHAIGSKNVETVHKAIQKLIDSKQISEYQISNNNPNDSNTISIKFSYDKWEPKEI